MGNGERAGACGERNEVGVGGGMSWGGGGLYPKGCWEGGGQETVGKGMQGGDCRERDVGRGLWGRGLWGKGCREGTVGKGV